MCVHLWNSLCRARFIRPTAAIANYSLVSQTNTGPNNSFRLVSGRWHIFITHLISTYIDLSTICSVSAKQSREWSNRITLNVTRNPSKFPNENVLQATRATTSNKIPSLCDNISFLVISGLDFTAFLSCYFWLLSSFVDKVIKVIVRHRLHCCSTTRPAVLIVTMFYQRLSHWVRITLTLRHKTWQISYAFIKYNRLLETAV